jgi:Fe-S cluster assembly iron-binding protein IscA
MFEVSPSARARAAAFVAGREKKPIRIYVSTSGSRKQLAMALDRVRTTDAVFDIDGVTYVINRDFLQTAQSLRIDYGPDGFAILSPVDLEGLKCTGCKAAGNCGL